MNNVPLISYSVLFAVITPTVAVRIGGLINDIKLSLYFLLKDCTHKHRTKHDQEFETIGIHLKHITSAMVYE